MIHSSLVDPIPDDDQGDVSDEYEELTLSSRPFPLTPATKRAYKGTSSIYVDIEDTVLPVDERRSNNNEMAFPSELLYSTDDGNTFIDALIIPGERTKKNLFALKLVDKIFSEKNFWNSIQ
ncbi:unnamed protein product [Rotaria sp. Silwood1]|nr:unnamed protein product [Rotaria sp. Silwood1]